MLWCRPSSCFRDLGARSCLGPVSATRSTGGGTQRWSSCQLLPGSARQRCWRQRFENGSPKARDGTSVAWVSLDARDGDAARFWTYALQALDVASPGCAAAALSQLEGGHDLLADVITSLINELSVRPDDVTLVLDDYHLADTPDVGETLSFLLDHRPPQLHLIISTRADPALPLPRLRARGELVEIRASDLRFTTDEAENYLNTVHDLRLSASDVEALESRTEGWVAALQLAALSLHGHDDSGGVHRNLRRG